MTTVNTTRMTLEYYPLCGAGITSTVFLMKEEKLLLKLTNHHYSVQYDVTGAKPSHPLNRQVGVVCVTARSVLYHIYCQLLWWRHWNLQYC
jgi:hypothetical protein